MWAVNNVRLTKPMTSTDPAIALSTDGSRRCNSARSGMSLEGNSEGGCEFNSIAICNPSLLARIVMEYGRALLFYPGHGHAVKKQPQVLRLRRCKKRTCFAQDDRRGLDGSRDVAASLNKFCWRLPVFRWSLMRCWWRGGALRSCAGCRQGAWRA